MFCNWWHFLHPSGIPPQTALSTGAVVGITVVVTGIVALIVGFLAGILLYHCIHKHRKQSTKVELVSFPNQQEQTDEEYEEVPTNCSGILQVSDNMAYGQRIELKENVSYAPMQHWPDILGVGILQRTHVASLGIFLMNLLLVNTSERNVNLLY